MKKLVKIFSATVLALGVIGFAACGAKDYTHTYDSDWTRDETYHWHKATCSHAEEVSDKNVHADGNGDYKCDTCAYDMRTRYTVTFDANGGVLGEGQASMTVKDGDAYGSLPTPTRAGYTFNGWYTQTTGGIKMQATEAVMGSHTLYAQWTANAYTLTLNANGGVLDSTNAEVTVGVAYGTLPTPTREGYTFDGWYTQEIGGTKVDATTTVSATGDHTLYAHWIANAYTLMLNANGGTVSVSTVTVYYKGTYDALPTPTQTGYTFLGWYTQETGGTKVDDTTRVTTAADHTLYAQWISGTVTTCVVYYDANGGTVGTESATVTIGASYGRLPTPTREGYTFDGWYTQATGGTKIEATTTVTSVTAHTLYARWTAASYTLSYNANGGTVGTTSATVTYGGTYGRLPTPTREGYTFNGWYTQATGGTKIEAATTVTATADHTLYAQWTANSFTVTLNANGGTVSVSTITVYYDSTYGTLPTPTRDNYTFNGWFTAATGGSQITSTTTVKLTGAQQLYAQWTVGSSSGDGGDSGDSGDTDVPAGSDLDLTFPTASEEAEEATPTAVSQTQLINTLNATPYRSAVSNTDSGLTEANAVGADERAFSRILYPVPIGGSDYKYYNVNDYGVSPSNTSSNTRDLNNLITSLSAVEGAKVLVFEAGTYYFSGTINISNMEHVYLAGNNTNFVYTSWCTAIKISSSNNIHLNGISIDFDPSPVVAGTIVSKTTNTVTIQLDSEFSLTSAMYNNGTINYGSYMEYTTDSSGTYYPLATGNLRYNSTGDGQKMITGGSYVASSNQLTLTFASSLSSTASSGRRVSVAFTMYEHPCVSVSGGEGFYMEGCNIYTAAGMGIHLASVKNTYLNRTNIMLNSSSTRLMTVTADGIHAKDCLGDLQVTGSIFESSHDDAMNIGSLYKTVNSYNMRTVTCTTSSGSEHYPIQAGDVIEIYNPADFTLFGEYTVQSVTVAVNSYTLTLNRSITSDITGYLVGNVTRSPKVKVNDCIIRNKRNRGILLQTRNSDISGNTFQNILHGVIQVHSVLDTFSEALVPRDVTITNNKFINNGCSSTTADVHIFATGQSGAATGVIKNVTISNNYFYAGATRAVYCQSAADSTIANNLMKSMGNSSTPVYTTYSTNVSVTNNIVLS